MRYYTKRTAIVLVISAMALIVTFGLAACGGTETTTSVSTESTAATPSNSETTASTAATGGGSTAPTVGAADRTQQAIDAATKDAAAAGPPVEPPKGKKIGFLLLSAQTEADMLILANVKEAAALFGFEVLVADWNFDTALLQTYSSSLLAQSPDLMVGSAADPSFSQEALKEAKKRNIPWVIVSALQNPDPLVTAQYVPDEKLMTATFDRWFFAEMQKRFPDRSEWKIGAFQAPPVGVGVRQRDEVRAADVAANPQIKEVLTHDLDLADPIQDNIRVTKQAMAQYPDISGFWQTADLCVAGNAQALDALGLKGNQRPVTGGFYSTRESRAGLLDGSVDGLVDLSLGEEGYILVDQAVEMWARGKAMWPDSTVFTKAYSLQFNVPFMMTKDNVDPNIDIITNPTADYKTYFKTKWAKEFGIKVD